MLHFLVFNPILGLQLTVVLDTSSLTEELRMYLPLYLEAMQESPILRDGKLIPHETVVAEFEEDTVQSTFSIGVGEGQHFQCQAYSQTVYIAIQVQ